VTASIVFRPEALTEFNDSADWYESRQLGLGVRFVNAIDAAIESLSKNPEHQAVVYKDVRLKSVKSFPYQIFYRIKSEALVEVLSVFHVRQNPEIWRERS
jgi:plasmid stabilization system protein ParE